MRTTRSDSGTARLDSRNAFRTDRAAVFAPSASAMVRTAMALRALRRARNRRSSMGGLPGRDVTAGLPPRQRPQPRSPLGTVRTHTSHAYREPIAYDPVPWRLADLAPGHLDDGGCAGLRAG